MKNWVWYQKNQLDELIPMVPFTPICRIITKIDEISDPNKIFDFRNIFFFFNKPLQKLGSILVFVSLTRGHWITFNVTSVGPMIF